MPRIILLRAVGLILCSAKIMLAAEPDVDFAHDVVPVLKKHCVECHGGEETKGGLSLNTRELLLESEVVTPGKPVESRLFELAISTNPEEQMPPKDRPRMSAGEIAVLRRWIDEGLKWEAGFTFAGLRYEPPLKPRRPELPPARDGRNNPVDRLLDAYFEQHEIPRPAPVGDAVFLRRAHLDVIGLLPQPRQVDEFLADASPDKRHRLVRELLGNDIAYAEHWLTFWNDLLRNDYSGTGFITGGRKQITGWLYPALVENRPYDQFVRELIAPNEQAEGFISGIRWRGDVNASQTPEIQFAQNIAQAFLGINMKCASCHDSFIDRWTLQETYGLAQVYSTTPLILHRCDKSTGKAAEAAWIFPELGNIDAAADQPTRLKQLASLMTHPGNGRFTRTIVNRIWHRLMGRGIVHPVDAMHTEPWNSDLLDYLAVHFQDNGYDLKKTVELICDSQAYQAVTPAWNLAEERDPDAFYGPLARRMTAEQFMDSVWQITDSAPKRIDAQVLRFKQSTDVPGAADAARPAGQWIWSQAAAPGDGPKAGETVTFRRNLELKQVPTLAIGAITCDNEYALYVNGKAVQSDDNWESVEIVNLQSQLKEGANEFLIVAKNGGTNPNPAALYFEMRFHHGEKAVETIVTDSAWQWTASKPDGRGRFAQAPRDWQPAAVLPQPDLWNTRVGSQFIQLLAAAEKTPPQMVCASLMKNDAFLTALGRPTRDQIVSMRPADLTTLEAIDLANGQALADAFARGANRLLASGPEISSGNKNPADAITEWLYKFALSRTPTPDEATLARDLLGDHPPAEKVEDLLWAVFMLPEFQLIR